MPIPREPSLVRYEPLEYIVRRPSAVEEAIASGAPEAEVLWLVRNEGFKQCCGKVDVGGGVVKSYIEGAFVTGREVRFAKGVVVSRIQRR